MCLFGLYCNQEIRKEVQPVKHQPRAETVGTTRPARYLVDANDYQSMTNDNNFDLAFHLFVLYKMCKAPRLIDSTKGADSTTQCYVSIEKFWS